MAQRANYDKDTKFQAYSFDSNIGDTEGDKKSLGANSDGPHSYIETGGAAFDYLDRDGFIADMAGGACRDGMPHWSDPSYPMAIGRLETDHDSNDGHDLTNPPTVFRGFKHHYIRLGVEVAEDVAGEPK